MMNSEESKYLAGVLTTNANEEHQARMEVLNSHAHRLKPKLSIDGNQWCALYGENLQDGVAGFGDSPNDAYNDFDKRWLKKLPAKK